MGTLWTEANGGECYMPVHCRSHDCRSHDWALRIADWGIALLIAHCGIALSSCSQAAEEATPKDKRALPKTRRCRQCCHFRTMSRWVSVSGEGPQAPEHSRRRAAILSSACSPG